MKILNLNFPKASHDRNIIVKENCNIFANITDSLHIVINRAINTGQLKIPDFKPEILI